MRMARAKTPLILLTFTMVLSALSIASANEFAIVPIPTQYKENATQHRNFLVGLGFEDYALQARATAQRLRSTGAGNPVAPYILDENVERYKPLSYAREAGVLAHIGLVQAKRQNREQIVIQRLLQLSAYHLLPFALMGLEPVPESVYEFKIGDPAEALREKYLIQRAVQRYSQEKKAFIAAFLEILFTEKEIAANSPMIQSAIQRLDVMASEIFKPEYYTSSMQQNRYLGRALTATLIQYSRERGIPQIENDLRAKLASEGTYLDNHISSTLTFRDRSSRPHQIRVYSGDIANEYSTLGQAYQIAVGVLPAKRNAEAAKKYKLVASYKYVGSAFVTSTTKLAVKKLRSNMLLSEEEERVMREVWEGEQNRGFSHAGISEVKTDARSGISMVWIWDIFPRGKKFGGIRLQTPENFANTERFNRIGFVHYDSAKAYTAFKKQVQTRGYLPTVWDSMEATLVVKQDGNADVKENAKKMVGRRSFADQATVMGWAQLPEDKAATWYEKEAVPRALKMVRNYLVGEEVQAFASGFKNIDHTLYCSQMVLLAYLQGANFDPQTAPDEWRSVAKLGELVGKVNMKERIISPSGFAWQEELTSTVSIVDLDRTSAKEQMNTAPHLNGKPTVIERRLQILQPILQSAAAQMIDASKLQTLDSERIDVEDEDL